MSQQDVADQIDVLLKSGEADDADDFRRRERVFQERVGLNATITNSLEQLQRISGPGDALAVLRTTLSKTDLQTIRDDVRQCEARLEEIDEQRSELDTEPGRAPRQTCLLWYYPPPEILRASGRVQTDWRIGSIHR